MNKYRIIQGLIVLFIILIMLIIIIKLTSRIQPTQLAGFDSERALKDVIAQMEFGSRTPGSSAHEKTIEYIQTELKIAGWQSSVLNQTINGHKAQNILATRQGNSPVILLGTHFDSRIYADKDPIPENRTTPVPGANDGASGVAVLLELARIMPEHNTSVALLFIDIEDNGQIPGWDWIQGSRAFASDMPFQPQAVVIIDMIGDADLNIYMEKSSDEVLTNQIWETARVLGYETYFIPQYKYTVIDDHSPFLEKGIRAVDIIDLDYPYWHTLQDLSDKISSASMKKVGDTLLKWIETYGPCMELQNCK